ncbi:MAG: D-Ala-D-Ala carboxypeptidase family metallohydrolase [Bellilinea sp.]
MNLTDHFTLEELTFSSTARRKGIENTPSLDTITRLTIAAQGMEYVRHLLGDKPIHIDSGYRSPALNAAVGGVATSAHLSGYAVDFICPAFGSPLDIVKVIDASGIVFDQCIQEGTWVHMSFDPKSRMQVLTAHFDGGHTHYSSGSQKP